ncbi:hypothetical protein BIW11_10099 [Tropilaelaps mercedesae]|uniref:Homeobox domain-containing protein n=1 Tax=Tropilaelaps mercedesae TaxID=418985 RepID=A0A1V9XHA4_9ACAR|nr:hypothetical protein BIW11_10099 [Tropilaelaps mercedesae]
MISIRWFLPVVGVAQIQTANAERGNLKSNQGLVTQRSIAQLRDQDPSCPPTPIVDEVWFQNRRAKCRKHESQLHKNKLSHLTPSGVNLSPLSPLSSFGALGPLPSGGLSSLSPLAPLQMGALGLNKTGLPKDITLSAFVSVNNATRDSGEGKQVAHSSPCESPSPPAPCGSPCSVPTTGAPSSPPKTGTGSTSLFHTLPSIIESSSELSSTGGGVLNVGGVGPHSLPYEHLLAAAAHQYALLMAQHQHQGGVTASGEHRWLGMSCPSPLGLSMTGGLNPLALNALLGLDAGARVTAVTTAGHPNSSNSDRSPPPASPSPAHATAASNILALNSLALLTSLVEETPKSSGRHSAGVIQKSKQAFGLTRADGQGGPEILDVDRNAEVRAAEGTDQAEDNVCVVDEEDN